MIMKRFIVLSLLLAVMFGGCTAKEFGEGVDSITNDIADVFEEGRDKSSE